jgi:hypothetical protein
VSRTYILPLAFLVLTVALAGCSGKDAPAAKLSGAVTYNGQPVKAGNLRFHTSDGLAYSGVISPDGTYTATDLPDGELVVTLETEHLNPNRKAGAVGKDFDKRMKYQMQPAPSGAVTPEEPYIKVPEKYGNPRTSPVTITATRGRQVKDIEFPQ